MGGKRTRRDNIETIEKSVVQRVLVATLTEQFQLKQAEMYKLTAERKCVQFRHETRSQVGD